MTRSTVSEEAVSPRQGAKNMSIHDFELKETSKTLTGIVWIPPAVPAAGKRMRSFPVKTNDPVSGVGE